LTKVSFFRINANRGFEKCFNFTSNLHNKLTMNTSLKKLSFAAVFVATFVSAQAATSTLTFDFNFGSGAGSSYDDADAGLTAATASDIVTAPTYASNVAISAPFVTTLASGLAQSTTLTINVTTTSGTPTTGNTGQMPGLGSGSNGEIQGTTALNINFDQPVVLTSIAGGWWDGDGTAGYIDRSNDSYALTIGTTTVARSPGATGGENSDWSLIDGGAAGAATPAGGPNVASFAVSTVDGVTGVFLPAGTNLSFSYFDTNNSGTGNDNGALSGIQFSVVNVPEPTSLTLGALGLLGLLRRRRA
jgi:hypothetical protein